MANTTLPTVETDLLDYAPGSTAIITASNFLVGSTIAFQVSHVLDPGKDGRYGTLDDKLDAQANATGEGHEPWYMTDGVRTAGADGILGNADDQGDLDGLADGTIVTSWYVNPDDSAGATFLLTATGITLGKDGKAGTKDDGTTGQVASNYFTDAKPVAPPAQEAGKIDQLYQWANVRADWETGNLSNKAIMQEGDVVPYFVEFSDFTIGQTYTVVIEWDTTHLGLHAFDYMTSYNLTDFFGFDPNLSNPTNPAFEIGLGDGG